MLVIGVHDKELRSEEREWLRTPVVSGVILFARNFASREQVIRLIAEIRALRPDPAILRDSSAARGDLQGFGGDRAAAQPCLVFLCV